jgi:integrin alpha FG-GAP repeat containing protein 1
VNVIPADFDQDGRLDVLLMFGGEKNGWWGGEADTLGMEVILGAEGESFGASLFHL